MMKNIHRLVSIVAFSSALALTALPSSAQQEGENLHVVGTGTTDDTNKCKNGTEHTGAPCVEGSVVAPEEKPVTP